MIELQIGNSARFQATIRDPDGTLKDVTGQIGQLWQAGTQLGSDATPTKISLGVYQWTLEIPAAARKGKCTVYFYGTESTFPVAGSKDFLIIDIRD